MTPKNCTPRQLTRAQLEHAIERAMALNPSNAQRSRVVVRTPTVR